MDEAAEILQAELLEEFRVSAPGHIEGQSIAGLVEDFDVQAAATGPSFTGDTTIVKVVAPIDPPAPSPTVNVNVSPVVSLPSCR